MRIVRGMRGMIERKAELARILEAKCGKDAIRRRLLDELNKAEKRVLTVQRFTFYNPYPRIEHVDAVVEGDYATHPVSRGFMFERVLGKWYFDGMSKSDPEIEANYAIISVGDKKEVDYTGIDVRQNKVIMDATEQASMERASE